ncbi:unnamed protein product [Effrenium voratum]|nr:unnamed protein product [Effrenium voratum]
MDDPSTAGFRGQLALDVGPAPPEGPAPGPKPPPEAERGGTQLRLAIHRVEGALCTSTVSPLVRVHVVDAATGYRWGKPIGPCVFNVDKDGAAYLRTAKAELGKEQRLAPWFADSGQSSFFRPFCTLPKRAEKRELPVWDEAFFLQVQQDLRMAFLFEVLDARMGPDRPVLSPVAWGFLHLSALSSRSGAKRRVQLWKYRRRAFCGRVALEEDGDDIPLVVQEYIAAGVGDDGPGALSATFASLLGRGRQKWPAALEFTLSVSQKPIQLERPLPQDASDPRAEKVVVKPAEPGSPGKAETVAGEEILGQLAPQHVRKKDQACALPDELLWQMPSGKRGASRMAISPSSLLLAVATVRSGSAELRIHSLQSGRLLATCPGHDAMVHDLCWHSFSSSLALASPLLISCGGSRVLVHEVPEDLDMPLTFNPPQLKVHARVNFSSHVYSVRPHPTLSTDPRCLLLLCAGEFGLSLCQVSREIKAAGSWTALPPQVQQVQYDGHHKSGHGREASAPDVLCVRFSPQANSAENVYVTDSSGHIMLFQIRYDASAGVTASRVRTYAGSDLLGAAIYSLEIVTMQLLQGKRISSVQLSMADDWALVFSRDHVIRLVSLQRGVLKVEQKMVGITCSSYPVKGVMSPDGAFVVSGSESGELLFWGKETASPCCRPRPRRCVWQGR